MHAQEEEEMGVTEEQAYAPITYNDGSSIDFQDKTLLNLTLEREWRFSLYTSGFCVAIPMASLHIER